MIIHLLPSWIEQICCYIFNEATFSGDFGRLKQNTLEFNKNQLYNKKTILDENLKYNDPFLFFRVVARLHIKSM